MRLLGLHHSGGLNGFVRLHMVLSIVKSGDESCTSVSRFFIGSLGF